MSIRVTALFVFVVAVGIYAWKDWFKSLCCLIILMAIFKHGDMPRTMLGIIGLNPWNVLFGVIFFAWLASRRREGLRWDMPCYINVLLLMYLGVILIGVLRSVFDLGYMSEYAHTGLIIEGIFNTVKWILPGILLFDGCRSRRRVITALVCLLVMYFLIAQQVIDRMPIESAIGNLSQQRRLHICSKVGYSACDLSTMLAGTSWGVLAAMPLVRRKKYRMLVLATAGIFVLGQAMTGGRAGYLAWGATGLVLCLLKWRKYLILAPVVVMLLPIVFPGAADRMLTGFGQTDVAGQSMIDDFSVTSGRTYIWPYVIDKIGESPLVGYGRMAMKRTGLTEYLGRQLNDPFPHPHNMYLETLLDNGILGSLPIFLFWGTMILYSARLFKSNNRLCSAVGGMALALTLAQLFGGIGSQHFYPRESTLGMWATMFLSLRVYIEWARVREGMIIAESSWNGQSLQQQVAITPVCAHGITTR